MSNPAWYSGPQWPPVVKTLVVICLYSMWLGQSGVWLVIKQYKFSPPGPTLPRGRVEHSHWSRSIEIACSDWLNVTTYTGTKVYAIATHLKASKIPPTELCLYGRADVSNMLWISDLEWSNLTWTTVSSLTIMVVTRLKHRHYKHSTEVCWQYRD